MQPGSQPGSHVRNVDLRIEVEEIFDLLEGFFKHCLKGRPEAESSDIQFSDRLKRKPWHVDF